MTHACTTCCTWCASANRNPGQSAGHSVLRTRRTIAELTRLDDHLLCDIGIDRERIPMIAQGSFIASGEAPRRDIPAAPCPREYLREAANDSRPLAAAA